MYDGGRRNLPMYEVRSTMYDLEGSCTCGAGIAKQELAVIMEAVRGNN